MRCWFGHQWKWHGATPVHTYWDDTASRPYLYETEVSGTCVRCGLPKVKTISGTWVPS